MRVEQDDLTHLLAGPLQEQGHFEGHVPPEGVATDAIRPLRLHDPDLLQVAAGEIPDARGLSARSVGKPIP